MMLPHARVAMHALALALAGAGGHAQGAGAGPATEILAPTPTAPPVALTQRLGAQLPLQAEFTDSTGRALRLGDEFALASLRATPAILVLGYYRCPQLCGLLMQGLLEATRDTGLPPSSWHIVYASIDPSDTPGDAALRRRVAIDYARLLADDDPASTPPSIDLLVGPPSSIDALARSIGYDYVAAPATARPAPAMAAPRFAHPAGIVVVTPDGRVSRYLMGVRFEPGELRAALVEASGGRIGTLTDRIALMCAHIDPRAGRWSATVLHGLRAAGIASMLALAVFVWRQGVRARKESRP